MGVMQRRAGPSASANMLAIIKIPQTLGHRLAHVVVPALV